MLPSAGSRAPMGLHPVWVAWARQPWTLPHTVRSTAYLMLVGPCLNPSTASPLSALPALTMPRPRHPPALLLPATHGRQCQRTSAVCTTPCCLVATCHLAQCPCLGHSFSPQHLAKFAGFVCFSACRAANQQVGTGANGVADPCWPGAKVSRKCLCVPNCIVSWLKAGRWALGARARVRRWTTSQAMLPTPITLLHARLYAPSMPTYSHRVRSFSWLPLGPHVACWPFPCTPPRPTLCRSQGHPAAAVQARHRAGLEQAGSQPRAHRQP